MESINVIKKLKLLESYIIIEIIGFSNNKYERLAQNQ